MSTPTKRDIEQADNVANAQMHKHCIFCGTSSDAGGFVGAICPSKNNTFPPNTVGDRPHAYPVDGVHTVATSEGATTTAWKCRADRSGAFGNDPQDCDWPVCGCDPYADKVIEALIESGWGKVQPAAPEGHTPGPWEVGLVDHQHDISNVRNVMLLLPGNDAVYVTGTNQEANAKLIAAAPALLAENNRLREALRKIAYEPFGPADASFQAVLDSVIGCAQQALAAGKGESDAT